MSDTVRLTAGHVDVPSLHLQFAERFPLVPEADKLRIQADQVNSGLPHSMQFGKSARRGNCYSVVAMLRRRLLQ
jgi:hypothetical protein